jgi:thioredoxin reductase (NADPH)
MTTAANVVDCVVVGGGPAGLTAALYLARYRRSVKVFDSGESRALMIPVARNLPGFPSGISGSSWLSNVREQAAQFGVCPQAATVTIVTPCPGGFRIEYSLFGEGEADSRAVIAKRVLIACGVRDSFPEVSNARELTRVGVLRLCPICDGYETDGKRIGILGPARCALSHARFMRTFTRTVSILANDLGVLSEAELRMAESNNISFVTISSTALTCNDENGVQVSDVAGKVETFDSVYPVMGCTPVITALDGLDILRDDDGMIVTDKHQRTCVEHIYADVGGRRHRGDSHSSEP